MMLESQHQNEVTVDSDEGLRLPATRHVIHGDAGVGASLLTSMLCGRGGVTVGLLNAFEWHIILEAVETLQVRQDLVRFRPLE